MWSKIKTWLTVVVFLSLILVFVESMLNKEVFADALGISPQGVTLLFLLAEIFFNLGVFLMLKGSGMLNIKFKDLIKFKFENLKFNTPLFTVGFVMNRLAATIPWIYILTAGWNKLPNTVVGLMILELIVVVIISLSVIEITEKYAYKRS